MNHVNNETNDKIRKIILQKLSAIIYMQKELQGKHMVG